MYSVMPGCEQVEFSLILRDCKIDRRVDAQMDFLNPYATADVALIDLIRNIGVGLLIAVIWALVISKSTRLVVDTRQYLPVFLLLIPSMILIITIIKSSIALSLGLVGALSIVRFRTPIKEPEELLYLFVAIAVGLGLGANQLVATLTGFTAVCLAFIPFALLNTAASAGQSTFIDIIYSGDRNDFSLESLEGCLRSLNLNYSIKRIDSDERGTELLLNVSRFNMSDFEKLERELLNVHAGVKVIATENARVIT